MAKETTSAELSVAERELIDLQQEYKDAQKAFWAKQRGYKSREEALAAFASGELIDPAAEYLPKLLEYEATHRGEEVGINALMHIFSKACQGGDPDGPRFSASVEASERLKHYVACPLLPRAVGGACCHSLQSEASVRSALHGLLGLDKIAPGDREVIRFQLAKQTLEINRYVKATTERLAKLESGEVELPWPTAISDTRGHLASLPSIEESAAESLVALEVLRSLAADPESPRLAKIEGVDEQWNLVRAVVDSSRPRLSTIATALLFKEEHLTVGATTPSLEIELLDGSAWRLNDHAGKVVVIQFSFTGCGPCERMYPDLAELTEEHGDRLEILTLMRDETAEHAEAKVADGKLTWSIALDGKPGEVATRWSVDGFPEVYVIGPDGHITAIGLRGESLREEIDRLLGIDRPES